MIFNRLKQKSNQKFLNKVLNHAQASVNNKKIETVGILLNFKEFNDNEALIEFFISVGLKRKNIKIITYLNQEKEIPNSWDTFYYSKDFGWSGKINNKGLAEFVNTKFDALLGYYNTKMFELDVVSALSKANFKIGIENHNERLFDFIIKLNAKDITTFKKEVLMYLKKLNKIK